VVCACGSAATGAAGVDDAAVAAAVAILVCSAPTATAGTTTGVIGVCGGLVCSNCAL